MFFTKYFHLLLLLFLFSVYSLLGIDRYRPVILEKIEHDQDHFTQGLGYADGYFYESIGLYGFSKLIKYKIINSQETDVATKLEVVNKYQFSRYEFAEDITILENSIYLLTWMKKRFYVFDKNFQIIDIKDYDREGWGITHSEDYLITSDGSNQLVFRNKSTLEIERILQIRYQQKKLNRINALEMAEKEIYANVWFDFRIYRILPSNGEITAIIDCKELVDDYYEYIKKNGGNINTEHIKENTLNGIAYDKINKFFYLTGKRWPYIYRVKFVKSG